MEGHTFSELFFKTLIFAMNAHTIFQFYPFMMSNEKAVLQTDCVCFCQTSLSLVGKASHCQCK